MNICQRCVTLRVPMGCTSTKTRRSNSAAVWLCGRCTSGSGRREESGNWSWRRGKAENVVNIDVRRHTFPSVRQEVQRQQWRLMGNVVSLTSVKSSDPWCQNSTILTPSVPAGGEPQLSDQTDQLFSPLTSDLSVEVFTYLKKNSCVSCETVWIWSAWSKDTTWLLLNSTLECWSWVPTVGITRRRIRQQLEIILRFSCW